MRASVSPRSERAKRAWTARLAEADCPVAKSVGPLGPPLINHALAEFERRAHFGVFVVSQAATKLPFRQETLDKIIGYLTNPAKKFCQIWDKIGRTEVANFSPALARSLALSTERMAVDQVCGLLMKCANLG